MSQRKTSFPEATIEQIRESSRTIVRELGFFHKTFGKSGLTPAQGHMLLEIGKANSITQDRLAGILNLNQSTMSRNLKVLMQHQLIEVAPLKRDRRTKLLALTTKGIDELKLYNEAARKDVTSALAFLTEEQHQPCLFGLQLYALALKKANLKRGSYHQLRFRVSNHDDLIQEKIHTLLELINQAYDQSENKMRKHPGTRTTAKEIRHLLEQNALILAELDGTIVGSVSVSLLGERIGTFGMLATRSDYQGVGIGSGLVHAAEDWARSFQCTTMQLELITPRHGNHPRKELLKQWYHRLGYRPQSTDPFEQRNPAKVDEFTTDCDITFWQKSLAPIQGTQ